MNIYLVKRTDNVNYDEYDSFVCFAETEQEALNFDPCGTLDNIIINAEHTCHHWHSPILISSWVKCEKIGEAPNEERKGVILASFNAG